MVRRVRDSPTDGGLGGERGSVTYPPRIGVVPGRRAAQEGVVECVDVLALREQLVCVLGRCPHGRVAVDVAAEAARVVAQTITAGVGGQLLVGAHSSRAEGDDHAFSRSVSALPVQV